MRINTLWMSRSLLVLAISAVAVCPAQAVLGQKLASPGGQAQMRASGKAAASNTNANSLYNMQTASVGTSTVTEYSDLSGTVFAVTWSGVSNPDLSSLMGDYFPEYNQIEKMAVASRQQGHRRRPLDLSSSQVRVQRFGHMRDLHGRAFVPSLVPAGVNAQELM